MTEIVHDAIPQVDKISQAIDAIDRLTGAVEKLRDLIEGLGRVEDSRYTTTGTASNDMVNEKTMASLIGMTQRTLAEHRRRGRFPACRIKNGRRILWMPEQTLQAWKRGIA